MGLIERIFAAVFGDGRNVIVETAEVFRENAEGAASREAQVKRQAMRQFASEFGVARQGWFDRLMDGLNRLPRPLLAFGTISYDAIAPTMPRQVRVCVTPIKKPRKSNFDKLEPSSNTRPHCRSQQLQRVKVSQWVALNLLRSLFFCALFAVLVGCHVGVFSKQRKERRLRAKTHRLINILHRFIGPARRA